MATDEPGVEPALVERLAAICLGFPEARQEQAWTGTRWRIRGRTFAHVLVVDDGRPAAYAKAVGRAGTFTVVSFSSSGAELRALAGMGFPWWTVHWGRDVAGRVLDGTEDWDELAELLTESYCLHAPAKLAALVERPDAEA